jgi:hypothetical protein
MDREVSDGLGVWFHDQSRLQSAEVARAFSSALRAISQGMPQSEVTKPYEVTLSDADTDSTVS